MCLSNIFVRDETAVVIRSIEATIATALSKVAPYYNRQVAAEQDTDEVARSHFFRSETEPRVLLRDKQSAPSANLVSHSEVVLIDRVDWDTIPKASCKYCVQSTIKLRALEIAVS